jgi:hypothetical protein
MSIINIYDLCDNTNIDAKVLAKVFELDNGKVLVKWHNKVKISEIYSNLDDFKSIKLTSNRMLWQKN